MFVNYCITLRVISYFELITNTRFLCNPGHSSDEASETEKSTGSSIMMMMIMMLLMMYRFFNNVDIDKKTRTFRLQVFQAHFLANLKLQFVHK